MLQTNVTWLPPVDLGVVRREIADLTRLWPTNRTTINPDDDAPMDAPPEEVR